MSRFTCSNESSTAASLREVLLLLLIVHVPKRKVLYTVQNDIYDSEMRNVLEQKINYRKKLLIEYYPGTVSLKRRKATRTEKKCMLVVGVRKSYSHI